MDIDSKIPALPCLAGRQAAGRPDLSGKILLLAWKKVVPNKPFSLFFTKKWCGVKFLFFFFVSLGILIIGTPFLGLLPQENKNLSLTEDISPEQELALLNGNTLLPISELSGFESKVAKSIPVIVTAYSSTPWETQGNPFVTAAGTWVRDGIVANNKYSFGTKVRFPEIYGEKVFVVEDRMHSRKESYHFDIWFPSYPAAKEFGVKKTYIEVLEG